MKYIFIILLSVSFFSYPVHAFNIKNSLDACHTKGAVVIYDAKLDKKIEYIKYQGEKETLPASTFKIMHSLIALDRGVATPQTVFKWDGVKRRMHQWNQDLNIAKAFSYSAIWVYEKIKEQIPNSVYKRYLEWIGYGNGDTTHGSHNNFWVRGGFKVTLDDQINLLKGLYNETLPFSINTMNFVKSIMLSNDDKLGIVYSKTGWTKQDGKQIGWWVGYIEHKHTPLFFATRLIAEDTVEMRPFLECRKSITRDVLLDYMKKNNFRI